MDQPAAPETSPTDPEPHLYLEDGIGASGRDGLPPRNLATALGFLEDGPPFTEADFVDLFETNWSTVQAVVSKYVHDLDLAGQITQGAFESLLEELCRKRVKSARGAVFMFAKNAAIDYRRRKEWEADSLTEEGWIDVPEGGRSTEREAIIQLDRDWLRSEVQTLEDPWLGIALADIDGIVGVSSDLEDALRALKAPQRLIAILDLLGWPVDSTADASIAEASIAEALDLKANRDTAKDARRYARRLLRQGIQRLRAERARHREEQPDHDRAESTTE